MFSLSGYWIFHSCQTYPLIIISSADEYYGISKIQLSFSIRVNLGLEMSHALTRFLFLQSKMIVTTFFFFGSFCEGKLLHFIEFAF